MNRLVNRLDWRVAGLSTGSLLAISYLPCVAYDLAFDQRMYETCLKPLPGFAWLTWPSFSWDSSNRFSTESASGFCSRRCTTFSLPRFPLPGRIDGLEAC